MLLIQTVITLFQEIFKGSGSSYTDGRRKGGLKVHMVVPVYEQSPCVVHIGDGADNDLSFHKYLTLPAGSTVIMDRGYRSYPQFNLWTSMNIRWITRFSERTHYQILRENSITSAQKENGIEKDTIVMLGFPQKKTQKVKSR